MFISDRVRLYRSFRKRRSSLERTLALKQLELDDHDEMVGEELSRARFAHSGRMRDKAAAELLHEKQIERREAIAEVRSLRMQLLLMDADHLGLPIDVSRFKDEELSPGLFAVSEETLHSVSKAVRKERAESRAGLFQIAVVVVGVMGAMTGLIAVLTD